MYQTGSIAAVGICIRLPDYVPAGGQKAYEIRDNFADYCGIFISGNIAGADINGNTAFLCRNTFIKSAVKSPVPSGDGTEIDGATLATDADEDKGIRVTVLEEQESDGKIVTAKITVEPGDLVYINTSMNTKVWGHGLIDDNGDIVDAILGNRKGYYIIPDDVTGIRLTILESAVAESSITIYHSWNYVTSQEDGNESYSISIRNNKIIGATSTDYSKGLNVLGESISLTGYNEVTMESNQFENGTDNVIVLDECNKIAILRNQFINAPSYCVYIDPNQSPQEVTVKGTGKSYIKYTDCDRILIENNIAFGYKENDDSPFYVTNPVMDDDTPVEYSASNKFDHA